MLKQAHLVHPLYKSASAPVPYPPALCVSCCVLFCSFSQLTLFPACGDMCKDFVPDLNFRFSLGMSTMLVSARGEG